MDTLAIIFLAVVVLVNGAVLAYLFTDVFKKKELREPLKEKKGWINLSLAGLVTQFFDFMGIGSFATLTAWFKFTKAVPDNLIPGTLNTCTLFTLIVMNLGTITTIEVAPITLIVSAACCGLGGFIGAGIVSKLNINAIRYAMGVALIIVAAIIVARQLGLMPGGGEATGLFGWKLAVLGVVAFILGSLMTIGIGMYAPMMATVFLLGLSPLVAYPLFMGSAAIMQPFASYRFVREYKKTGKPLYDIKTIIAVSLAGTVGVLIGLFIITSIPLDAIKWMVSGVLVITSITMFRSARKAKTQPEAVAK